MLKFRGFTWSRFALSGPEKKFIFELPRDRSRLSALRLALVCAALSALTVMTSCDTFSPNVGVAPTQSSQVALLNPSSAIAGGHGFTLTVSGAGFVNGSTVLWNSQGRTTTFISTGQLTAQITAADLVNPGAVAVGVMSPGATTSTTAGNNLSNFLLFTVNNTNNSIPVITQLSPASATAGGPMFVLTVNGTGFISSSTVLWNNQSRATTFISATQLSAQILNTDIAAVPANQPQVAVFNPAPGGGTSNSLPFTITSIQSALKQGTTQSLLPAAAQHSPAISAGHRFIAFVAPSANSPAGSNTVNEIFWQDTCQGAAAGCVPQTTLVTMPILGNEPDGDSRSPSLSADGRFVAFVSDATNLVAGDHNGFADVFLRDTCTGAAAGCTPSTTRLSVGPNGAEANGDSASASISSDGRYVAYDSAATNLVLDNFSATSTGPYLWDTCWGAPAGCTPSTTRLTVSATPAQ